jgi:putative two-component system response regulator
MSPFDTVTAPADSGAPPTGRAMSVVEFPPLAPVSALPAPLRVPVEKRPAHPVPRLRAVPAEPETVLVVDDDPAVRNLLRDLLAGRYQVVTAASVADARAVLGALDCELVLTDLQLPGESGITLVEWMAEHRPQTAVVMISGADDPEIAERALSIGAYGYVIKPFRAGEILITTSNALRRRGLELQHRQRTQLLEQAVAERTTELEHAQAETITRLSRLAEFRDDETGEHIKRVGRLSRELASALGFAPGRCNLIGLASKLHDVGKVAIPDSILLKPGPLDAAEWHVMRRHTRLGHEILAGSQYDVLKVAATIAQTHHERYDGLGYPDGLAGDAIPIEGRIVAVADVFDALTHDRVYRRALSSEAALAHIEEQAGRQFDPEIARIFVERTRSAA